MGVGDFDDETLRRWFADLAVGGANFEQDPAKYAISDRTAAEIDHRLAPVLDRLEREPDGSVLSRMLHAPDGPAPRAEVLSNLKLILLGGMQEPGHGAGNTLWAILSQPAARERLLADPGPRRRGARRGHALALARGHDDARGRARGERSPAWRSRPASASRRSSPPPTATRPAGSARTSSTSTGRARRTARSAPGRTSAPATGSPATSSGSRCGMLFERLPNLRLDPEQTVEITGWEFRGPRRLPVVWDA